MSSITIKLKNGLVRSFPHEPRPGGSYTKRLTFDIGFAIIEDEYGRKTYIPQQDIAEIFEEPNRR